MNGAPSAHPWNGRVTAIHNPDNEGHFRQGRRAHGLPGRKAVIRTRCGLKRDRVSNTFTDKPYGSYGCDRENRILGVGFPPKGIDLKHLEPIRRYALITSVVFGFWFSACSPLEPEIKGSPAIRAWDTSFVVNGISFSSSSKAVSRSQINMGAPERLSAFFRKCRVGGEVRIGFMGGSITAGALATASGNRYSTLLCGFLGKLFPKARFVEINTGIGATDSRYGASRVGSDLIRYSPDLYVVEFAVNDDYSDTNFVMSTMEGLIRQCLAHSSPVLIFQTMNRAGDTVNQHLQVELARHYSMPVVSYLRGVQPMVDSGSINLDTIMADAVHPTNQGHLLCAYLLYSYFKQAAFALGDIIKVIPALPAPKITSLYEQAGLWESRDSTIRLDSMSGWTRDSSELGRVEFTAGTPNAYLDLRCRVSEFTIGSWKRKDRTGVVAVSLDGSDVDTLRAEFPGDWGGGYLQLKRVFSSSELAEHKIGFRLLSGDTLELKAFLYAKQQ